MSVTKADSKFLGWYNGDEKVTAITSNVSLTAKWFEMVDGIFGYEVDVDSKTITFTFDPAMYKDVPDIETICILGDDNLNNWKTENTVVQSSAQLNFLVCLRFHQFCVVFFSRYTKANLTLILHPFYRTTETWQMLFSLPLYFGYNTIKNLSSTT